MTSSRKSLDKAIYELLKWSSIRQDTKESEGQILHTVPINALVDICRELHTIAGGGNSLKVDFGNFRNLILASLAIHPRMHAIEGDFRGLDAEKSARAIKYVKRHLLATVGAKARPPLAPKLPRQVVSSHVAIAPGDTREQVRVVFDASKPLGMVFRDTVVRKVSSGMQASQFGVQKGWRIAEVCGKQVIRGFRGSDRSIFHHLKKDKDRTIPLGVVFDCGKESKEDVLTAKKKGVNGAGLITLVFEANDVGLSIVTSNGVVDKVSVPSEPHSLGVAPGWVIYKVNSMPVIPKDKGISVDDFIQQQLCKMVSEEEPVKITFLLPHRLRPDVLSEIKSGKAGGSIKHRKIKSQIPPLSAHKRSTSEYTPRADTVPNSPHEYASTNQLSSPRDYLSRARLAITSFGNRNQSEEAKETSLISQWKAALRDWGQYPRDTVLKARKLAKRAGIPAKLRAEIWCTLLGNPVRVTPRYYDMLLAAVRAQKHGTSGKTNGITKGDTKDNLDANTVTGLINTDISRTFANLTFFQKGCLLHDQLSELLCVYSKYRPDVGYIQGMSFLAGHLLLYIEDVYMAFVALANLLNTPLFRALFKPKGLEEAFKGHYRLHSNLLRIHLPNLHNHLHKEGVQPDMYLLEWILTLFSRRLRLDTAGRVWDMYLTHGELFVHRAAVGVVKVLEKDLLGASFAECLKILKEAPSTIEPNTLIMASDSVKISKAEIALLRQDQMREGSRGYYIGEQW
mmetsp:Transcript_24271/g.36403  ORF Transcript_24271/g.36403 Transcript_24271/m.36403 type:complete len:737 (-) Transcript_24271:220-2430(-)